MSYILDALNKSQRERRRGEVPTLGAAAPVAPKPLRRSTWLAAAALIVAVLGLAYRGYGPTSAPPAGPVADRSPPETVPLSPPPTRGAPTAPPTAAIAPLTRKATIPAPANEVAPQVRARPAAAPVPPPALAWGELDPALRQAVGDLRLNIHVYSERPAERFAYINDRHYSEGETVREGPVLEQVTPTGVVLAFRGERFRLDM